MKQITVMKNHNKNNSPVGDGDSNNHLPSRITHKKIITYCKPDYCLSCAYFQQIKGNFGRCTVLKNDKKYDGTKKGSSCSCWRLDKNLIEIELESRLIHKPKPVLVDKNYKPTIKIRNKKPEIQLEIPFIKKNVKWLHKLPYAQTSDIHPMKYYPYHKFNYRIINFAIELLDKGEVSQRRIAVLITKKFGKKISHQSISLWRQKFRPLIKTSTNPRHTEETKKRISEGMKKYHAQQMNPNVEQHSSSKVKQDG